jgi:hypothetical protein
MLRCQYAQFNHEFTESSVFRYDKLGGKANSVNSLVFLEKRI